MCLVVLLLWFDLFVGDMTKDFELPMDEETFQKMEEMALKMS